MVEVVLSVEKVSALIAEIAQASQEQSAGIGQVNSAVTQMQRVVERNAAMVEHAARATETMNGQAAELLKVASRFQLAAAPGEPQRPAPERAAAAKPAPAGQPAVAAKPAKAAPAAVPGIRVRPAPSLPPARPAPVAKPRETAGGWTEF
jgi:hypothetical protein